MKTDLKTNIKFFQVSNRYYRPENEIELASLTRYEKLPTTVVESAEQGAHEAALEVVSVINQCVETFENKVLFKTASNGKTGQFGAAFISIAGTDCRQLLLQQFAKNLPIFRFIYF